MIPRLAWFVDFSPIAHVERDQPTGTAYPRLQSLLAAGGLAVEFVPAPQAEARSLLTRGAVDGIACMAVTDGRTAVFDFSLPYLPSSAAFFVDAARPGRVGLEDLKGLAVATPGNGPLVQYLGAPDTGVRVVPVAGYREALEAVLSGEAAAAALNLEVGTCLVETWFPGRFFLPASFYLHTPLGLAMTKGRWSAFIRRFNREVRRTAEGPAVTGESGA